MNRFLLSLSLILPFPIVAQTLNGTVLEEATGKPLPFVNVYLNNTTKGTQTDEQGRFRLTGFAAGYQKVVASMVGFAAVEQEISLQPDETQTLSFRLKATVNQLTDVRVRGQRDRDWKRFYPAFERQFLGRTPNARKSRITNKFDVTLIRQPDTLRATSDKPLQIENNALGYSVTYNLTDFEQTPATLRIRGQTFFTELPAPNEEVRAERASRRLTAYRGSLRHFLHALAHGRARAEGFRVFVERDSVDKGAFIRRKTLAENLRMRLVEVNPDSLVQFDRGLQRAQLPQRRYELHYLNRKDPQNWYYDVNREVSWLEVTDGPLMFSYAGLVQNPWQVTTIGSLVKRRIADLLPDDYEPPVVVSSANNLLTDNVLRQEKVLLETNQRLFWPGDTLYFRANVLDATTHEPSRSRVLHLTFRTEQRVVWQGPIMIDEGLAGGHIALPDTLPEGVYQLTTHTTYGQRTSPDFAGRVSLRVLGPRTISQQSSRPDSVRLQLLPEGGILLAGVAGRVGIRTTNPQGQAVAMSGAILNAVGDTLTRFRTNAEGRGLVTVSIPAEGKCSVRLANGQVFTMIPTTAKGYGLRVDLPKSDATLPITVLNNLAPNERQPVRLVVHTRGQVLHETELLPQQALTRIRVPLDVLSVPGVSEVLLLDQTGHVIARRPFFRPDTTAYAVQSLTSGADTLWLRIGLADVEEEPLNGKLPAVQARLNTGNPDTPTTDWTTQLLLSSDLSDGDPLPSLNISNPALVNREVLDMVLLTSSVRPYWQAVRDNVPYEMGLSQTGTASYSTGSRSVPAAQAKLVVLALSGAKPISFLVETDTNGQFTIPDLPLVGRINLLIQGSYGAGKPVNVTLDSARYPPLPWKWMVPPPVPPITSAIKAVLDERFSQVQTLNAVTVKARKVPVRDPRRDYLYADRTLKIGPEQIIMGNVKNVLMSQGLFSLSARPEEQNVLVFISTQRRVCFLLNGMIVDWSMVESLSPQDVQSIDILTSPALLATMPPEARGGAVNILTHPNPGSLYRANHLSAFTIQGFALPDSLSVHPVRFRSALNNNPACWYRTLPVSADGRLAVPLGKWPQKGDVSVQLEGTTTFGTPVSVGKQVEKP